MLRGDCLNRPFTLMGGCFLLTLSLAWVKTQFNSIQVFPIATATDSKQAQGPM